MLVLMAIRKIARLGHPVLRQKARDLSSTELAQLLDLAEKVKAQPSDYTARLAGLSVAMIFEKPSTRTRVSFEVGIAELGGAPLIIDSRAMQIAMSSVRLIDRIRKRSMA